MEELTARDVRITGGFWGQQLETNARRAIFHQWRQLEASGCISNFRIAAREMDGFRTGWFFADSDAYKWLEAAARILATQHDPALQALVDEFVGLVSRAQEPDGYLFTYNQIHFPGTRWVNLQIEHELYCHGHLIEAGVSHYEGTGQTALLTIARRAADLIVRDFSGRGPAFTPGHEEIEVALLRLYRLTGHAPYLEMARQFIEQRGRTPRFAAALWRQNTDVARRMRLVREQRRAYLAAHPGYEPPRLPPGNLAPQPRGSKLRWYVSALTGKYFQQHAPVRQQTVPVGHAVRFGYLQTAIAMLHRLSGDDTLLPALRSAWEHMVTRRMYVTGGLGSVPGLEGFGRDYELDPQYAYAETCAALASLFWNWQMALITGEAKYSDLFEWQLYNAAAVGMGRNGESYLYNNPLACAAPVPAGEGEPRGVTRRAWYAVPCCPSNISRTWAWLGRYLYGRADDGWWVHQYITSQANFGDGTRIEMESGLPWDGRIRMRFSFDTPVHRTLRLRIPSWADSLALSLNGQRLSPDLPQQPDAPDTACGYAPHRSSFLRLEREWRDGDVLTLDLGMSIRLHRQDRRVPRCGGMVALSRGPLVYCLESVDNPGVDLFGVAVDTSSLRPCDAPDLLGGVTLLQGMSTGGQQLTFIPYLLWANRGPSQMNVFARALR